MARCALAVRMMSSGCGASSSFADCSYGRAARSVFETDSPLSLGAGFDHRAWHLRESIVHGFLVEEPRIWIELGALPRYLEFWSSDRFSVDFGDELLASQQRRSVACCKGNKRASEQSLSVAVECGLQGMLFAAVFIYISQIRSTCVHCVLVFSGQTPHFNLKCCSFLSSFVFRVG